MKRITNGDIFTIPIESGNFGLGQILRIQHPDGIGAAMMALFDIEMTPEEILEFDRNDCSFVEQLDLIAMAPLDMFYFRRSYNYKWKVIGNHAPVANNIPMSHSRAIGLKGEKFPIAVNFENTKFRYIHEDDLDRLKGNFIRSSQYFEGLLMIKFFDKNYLDQFPINNHDDWYIIWPFNCMTEDDMEINPHLYYDVDILR